MFKFGIENLLTDRERLLELESKRVALCAHPASVDKNLTPTWETISQLKNIDLVAAFGPQHGMRGEKQDNMIESDDYKDPILNIPVFSLYGKVRRPNHEMMQTFDVMLFDLQDVGCRIYTYLTTLFYVMEECHRYQKELWVLDRPNPSGRLIEGFYLNPKFQSFVGHAHSPMRHGMTLGEMALWYQKKQDLTNLQLKVIKMTNYNPNEGSWPESLSWVNPSPNLPTVTSTLVYPGSVLVEGTHLSEGRGTTRPLELTGASEIDFTKVMYWLHKQADHVFNHAHVRLCYFEPTFHKYKGQLCHGFQVHLDLPKHNSQKFKAFLFYAYVFKAIRQLYPNYDLWKKPPYEYEEEKMPIDILSGDSFLREWVDDSSINHKTISEKLYADENDWQRQRQDFLLY